MFRFLFISLQLFFFVFNWEQLDNSDFRVNSDMTKFNPQCDRCCHHKKTCWQCLEDGYADSRDGYNSDSGGSHGIKWNKILNSLWLSPVLNVAISYLNSDSPILLIVAVVTNNVPVRKQSRFLLLKLQCPATLYPASRRKSKVSWGSLKKSGRGTKVSWGSLKAMDTILTLGAAMV